MHETATIAAPSYASIPRSTQSSDGTWVAQMWQIGYADLDRWEKHSIEVYENLPRITTNDDPEIEIPEFLRRRD
jgi:hypothetical protein